MSGIYAMYFTGVAGSGHAVFVMKDGIVAGADVVGGLLDGTYRETGNGMIEVSLDLTMPPGSNLVTGAVAGQKPFVQQIKATLPASFADGRALPVETPTGPVNVIFKRLRDVP